MGFFDALFGRTTPKQANLDALFALPQATLTLQASTEFAPTGAGAVAFRAAEGGAFAETQREVTELLGLDPQTRVEPSTDAYGYRWLVVTNPDPSELVTSLHAVNTGLEQTGFGPLLLASLQYFAAPDGRRLALVYLYKRGTFYPFAPTGPNSRDNALELQVRGLVANDVPIESDVSRWSPLWQAPGL